VRSLGKHSGQNQKLGDGYKRLSVTAGIVRQQMSTRSNNAWTPEEDNLLLSMKAKGASFVRIAAKLRRSVTAVKGRHSAKKSQPLTMKHYEKKIVQNEEPQSASLDVARR
jgi:hypothetical protein